MFLQPSSGPADPWAVGAYPWSSAFLWIGAISALIFGMFLFASYVYNRKKQILLWSFAFLAIWRFYSGMIAGGSYNVLAGAFDYDMLSPTSSFFVLLIPALLAAGLLYDKDKKLGAIFLWVCAGLAVLYYVMLAEPNALWFGVDAVNAAGIRTSELVADIIQLLVTVVSGALIIALPIMKEGRLGPKTMVAIAGIFIVTTSILYSLLALVVPGFNFVDKVGMLFPFFFLAEVVCLIIGIGNSKDYGFTLPNIKFEEN